MSAQGAKQRLFNEFNSLRKEKWCNIDLQDEENLFRWTVGLFVTNKDSYYCGGYFKARITFRDTYPYSPPTFKFLKPIYHPNIYADGNVCISILHPPGDDAASGESASERWSSAQSVESVLRSILLLLDDPEVSSPANVDAGVLYRTDRAAYVQRAAADVERSKADIPEGFVMPTMFEEAPPPPKVELDDDFWNESGGEDDFGGSDSSGDDAEMNDFDEDEDGEQDFEDSEEDAVL